MNTRPPRIAEALLRAIVPADDRQAVLGDLAEEFAARVARDGRRSATRWYRRQALTSILPSLGGRIVDKDGTGSAVLAPSALVGGLRDDLRDALRSLRATPSVTCTALLVLTLGVGAGTAIFSVVDAVVLRGLPFDDADRLMAPTETRQGRGAYGVTPQDFLDWRSRQTVFEAIAGSTTVGEAFRLPDNDRSQQALRALRVTADLFPILRVSPQLGRLFTADDERDGQARVAIISDAFWRAHFGADPAIVGKPLQLTNGTWQIVGVMPQGFTYPIGTPARDLWVPYVMTPQERTRPARNLFNSYVRAVARLKPGVTAVQARAGMSHLMADMAAENPAWFKYIDVTVPTLKEAVVGTALRSWMLMLLGAVTCVLLVGAVNVANLLLARATVRSREIGIRAALGATRWRVMRSLLVESVLLVAAGTALGMVAAYWSMDIIRSLLPPGLPRADLIAVNLRVLVTAAAAALAAGVACGLVPGLHSAGVKLTGALREGGRSGTTSAHRQRARTSLMIAEVGLATILVVGAGLFVFSFARLMRIDIGLDYHDVLTVGVYPRLGSSPRPAQSDLDRAAATLASIAERARSLPGVESASVLDGGLPLSATEFVTDFTLPDGSAPAAATIEAYRVTPEYAHTVRLPLLRGRLFTDADDRATAAPIVLLNDLAARQYLGGRDPIGATVGVLGNRTVVGIVGGTRTDGPEADVRPEAYVPLSQGGIRSGYLLIRTPGDPNQLVNPVKALVTEEAPDARIGEFQTLDSLFAGLTAQRRFNMLLVGLFGVLAAAIASVGIYGVIAYLVEQRTTEIGVRLALGAVPIGVLRMILGHAAKVVGTGVVIGLVGAWVLARFANAFLFRIQSHDVGVYLFASGLLLLIGVLAALVPALRAARVDPVTAFRAS